MRFFALIIVCAVLTKTCAEPDPKKFKTEIKERDKQTNSSLTEDEKKFIKEVESKFGIKPETIEEKKKDEVTEKVKSELVLGKGHFPAVIAIEIVNDTDSKAKGKRTIDANLGYGYRTNNGYTYSYFGKPAQDQGKFMIYPYSQEDIHPSRQTESYSGHGGAQGGAQGSAHGGPHGGAQGGGQGGAQGGAQYQKYTKTNVEIQPSQAFELVTEKQDTGYHYDKPMSEFKMNYNSNNGLVSPPSYTHSEYSQGLSQSPPSTLYTTYNGEQFSGLSGKFPSVMQNYLVDPSQLLKNPDYQNAGLTSDHLRQHGSALEQRVVPVLVLRIPSSSLRNPTAELFANLPHNYPLSQYLNNVNLQQLVNQYFKKMGYSFAPQVMSYQNSIAATAGETHTAAPELNYEPQHYATPYVQPSYTHADYSGVQYSAVQPVMARYPSSYPQKHYVLSNDPTLYQPQQQQQQYEYQYQYVPQSESSAVSSQMYYVHPKYQQHSQSHLHEEPTAKVEYEAPSQVVNHEMPNLAAVAYGSPHVDTTHYESARTVAPEYGTSQEEISAEVSGEYDPSNVQNYGSSKEILGSQEYYTAQQPSEKETAAAYTSLDGRNMQQYSHSNTEDVQSYHYQQQTHEDSRNNGLALTENYPSKDHTIATVLPYNPGKTQQNTGAVQSVSYVTPMPYSYKYQSPYRVMVPQTVFKNPSDERVSYVNSQPMSAYTQASSHQEQNAEAEYTVGPHYIPPVSKQKPSYPRNYHSHPKRMVKPEHKHDSSTMSKKQSEKKKSS